MAVLGFASVTKQEALLIAQAPAPVNSQLKAFGGRVNLVCKNVRWGRAMLDAVAYQSAHRAGWLGAPTGADDTRRVHVGRGLFSSSARGAVARRNVCHRVDLYVVPKRLSRSVVACVRSLQVVRHDSSELVGTSIAIIVSILTSPTAAAAS